MSSASEYSFKVDGISLSGSIVIDTIPNSSESPNFSSNNFMFLFISIQISGHLVKKNSRTYTLPLKSSLDIKIES